MASSCDRFQPQTAILTASAVCTQRGWSPAQGSPLQGCPQAAVRVQGRAAVSPDRGADGGPLASSHTRGGQESGPPRSLGCGGRGSCPDPPRPPTLVVCPQRHCCPHGLLPVSVLEWTFHWYFISLNPTSRAQAPGSVSFPTPALPPRASPTCGKLAGLYRSESISITLSHPSDNLNPFFNIQSSFNTLDITPLSSHTILLLRRLIFHPW